MKRCIPLLLLSTLMISCAPKHGAKTSSSSKSSRSNETGESSKNIVECLYRKDVRKIEIKHPESGGCEVHYTNQNGSRIVADAKNDLSYCERTAKKIQENLEKASFSCN